MSKQTQMFAIIFQLLLLVACQSEEIMIEPPVSLTGKVQKLSFFTGNVEDKTYTMGYNTKGVFSSLLVKTSATTQYTPKVDSNGVLLELVQTAIKDTTKYLYNPQGKLKTIQASKGRSETFEYNKSGQLEYYTKQSKSGSTIVFEEVRSNKWSGQKLTSQIVSKPGKGFEEENMTYTTEVNPLQALFEKELRAIAMLGISKAL